ncbi:MAG: ATP-binding protein [Vicinamibacterales bacterium]
MDAHPVSRRKSLRLRLPLAIASILVLTFAGFLWATTRMLEEELVAAAGDRAAAATDQLAELLAQSVGRNRTDAERMAALAAVRQFATTPSAAMRENARLALAGRKTSAAALEIRDAQGRRLLAVPETARAAADHTDISPGIEPFRADGETVTYEIRAPIEPLASTGGAPAGANTSGAALVVRRQLTGGQNTETLNRLIGSGGAMAIGNRHDDVWTDFAKLRPAPLVPRDASGIAEYRPAGGGRKVGALRLIDDTPWAVWVEFPREAVVAPARTLMQRMLLIGLLCVVGVAALVWIVTSRITRPLHALADASEAIAGGDLSERVRVNREDEIGRLGHAFNAMAARIADAHQRLEERVAQRTASLEAANRELEAFSYSVSHDLRAPLRHVSGFTSLLEQSAGPALGPEARGHLQTIRDAAARMGQLIDDLLGFSRIGRAPLEQRPVDLNQLVGEARQEVINATGANHVTWDIHPLPAAHGDPSLLRLVLTNLLSNAVKYSARQPSARVEVGTVPGAAGEVVVYVRDNGEGFDMRYAQRLFGVFERLHPAEQFEGTGIGLANVRRIVERHGGRAWAEAVEGQGATFYVALPAAMETEAALG